MTEILNRRSLKRILGRMPLTAEIFWNLHHRGKPLTKRFNLKRVDSRFSKWIQISNQRSKDKTPGNKVVIFSMLHYWIEHATLLGFALSGLGHDVTHLYLPVSQWQKREEKFDIRRQNSYARSILNKTKPSFKSISILNLPFSKVKLPVSLQNNLRELSIRDVQYTLQVEEFNHNIDLLRFRLSHNLKTARAVFRWFLNNRPDAVTLPNGSILDFGAVYLVSKYLGIPITTYEFGEQADKIWIAHDSEVMRQETNHMWEARKDTLLQESQRDEVAELFTSRQNARLWKNFFRQWQDTDTLGGSEMRSKLELDDRPIVLLASNVLGDSLTLGREIFSTNMSEWLVKTVDFFSKTPEVQLLVRIHPGEKFTTGPSVRDLVAGALEYLPENIKIIAHDDPVNTYDLIEITDLGLVFTTTVGLEMAMRHLPVIVAGETHYRSKGFTIDPRNWDDYFSEIEKVLQTPSDYLLTDDQVNLAWNYAYRFFFEYPLPFPWHLLHYWDSLEEWSLEKVLSDEGQAEFGESFSYLAGNRRYWSRED